MFRFPIQFKMVLLAVLTVLALSIGVLNWKDRAAWSDPTDGLWWEETSEGLTVAAVEPGLGGDRGGLRVGDRLLRIDEQPTPTLKEYTQRIEALGTSARPLYMMYRPETGQNFNVVVEITGRRALAPTDVYRALTAILYLLVGLYIVFRSWQDPHAVHFYTLCLLSFVLYLFRYTTRLAWFDYLVYWSSSLALLALPAVFLHFSLVFPTRNGRLERNRWIVPGLYLVPSLLGVLQVWWFTGRLAAIGWPTTLRGRILMDQIQIAYFAAFFVAGAAAFLHQEQRTTATLERQRIKWISRGALAGALPFILFYAVPYILGGRPNPIMEASMLSLALIPLGFGYAIIKYRLMDVDLLFYKGVSYFIASATVLGGYFLLIVVGGRIGEEWSPEGGFLPIAVAALLTAFLFAPVRNKIQVKIDQLFYKGRYDSRASLLEFGKSLSSEISLPKVAKLVVQRIQQTFDIADVVVLLREDLQEDQYHTAVGVGLMGDKAITLTIPKEMIGLHLDGYKVRVSAELQALGIHYLQPLKVQGKIIGLIGLGEKRRREFLSSADAELLEALSGYTAIALENARLYKSVEQKVYEYAQLQTYSENIIESINVGVLVLDRSGRVTRCNPAFAVLYGMDRAAVIHQRLEDLFSPDFLRSVERAVGGACWQLRETRHVYKLVLDTRHGSDIIIDLGVNPLQDRGDGSPGTLMVFDDITQRIALEAQLLQSEKLSSIGLLAAGVAHEINTPIAGISSYTQMLLKQISDNDPKKELLSKIERQTFRAAEIVHSLLNFSRLNGAEFCPLNLNTTLQETTALLEHQFKNHHIRIEMELAEDLPAIEGNRGKLQQVFVNLFLNARDAMPKGGTLRVVTSAQGRAVVVDISDTGIGIPKEHIRRIYDPFFTTKGTKGTGLGLAVSYGIIQEHSGRIFVESHTGQGTRFTLKFPIAEPPEL